MKKTQKNIQSTKKSEPTPTEEELMEKLEARSNQVFTNIINPQQRISTDLTVRFPVTSNRGDKYLFFLFDYDRNSILLRPMKARTYKKLIRVFQDLDENLTTRRLNPNCMKLENKESPESQDLMK